jgi:hypothetical protein
VSRLARVATLGVALAFTAVVTAPPASAATSACPDSIRDAGYPDVETSNPHREAINCVTWWEITSGSGFGTYVPAAEVRRDQMATFLARLVESIGGNLSTYGSTDFEDVRYDNPHSENIARLADVGLVSGTSPGRYSPEATVSRAQMATFLVRAAEFAKNQALPLGEDAFDDDNGSPHENNINKAAAASFASGVAPRYYAAGGSVRRDQMATFMARVLNRGVTAGDTFVPLEQVTFSGDSEFLSDRFRLRSGAEYSLEFQFGGDCSYYARMPSDDDDVYVVPLKSGNGGDEGKETILNVPAATFRMNMMTYDAGCPWRVTLTRVL